MKYLLLLLTLISFQVFGQEYKFNVFSQEEGLPQPYVYDIIQTKNGFLYVATGDGLAYYGGNKFNKLTSKNGLTENFCNSLFLDSKQTIWVGHFEGGISCIENDVIRKISTKDYPAAKIVSFAEDQNHVIYYASSSGGLYYITNKIVKPFIKYDFTPINEIKISKNILYVASQTGLMYFDLKDKNPSHKVLAGTENKNITTIDFNSKGDLIIGIDGEGIEIYGNKINTFILIEKISNQFNNVRKNIKDIYVKNDQELWISLSGEGLGVVKLDNDSKFIKIEKITEKNGLKNMYTTKIFSDYENKLWFGTFGGGLYQFMSDRFELFNEKNYLPFNDVKSVCITEKNDILLTNETNIFELNNKIDTIHINTQIFDLKKTIQIRTTYYDLTSTLLYVGTNDGLMIYQKKSGNYKLVNEIKELKGHVVNSISSNTLHQFFIGTTDGLFVLNQNHQVINFYSTDNGLPHNNILGCYVENEKSIWLFSPDTPLYNMLGDSISLYKELNEFGSFKFNNAVKDKNENIWFGTDGGGVYKVSKEKKIEHFNTDNGLISDFIYSIDITDKGDIITGHRTGLSIKYAHMKNFRAITKYDGLQASNINANSFAKDINGNIWIGTTEGLLKYNPTIDVVNSNPPILSLTGITFNDKPSNLNDSIFTLSYGAYEVKINFIGVSLTNPRDVIYKYKLDGFNENWQTTKEQSIFFPKLEDGEYTLSLVAINSDGFQSDAPLCIKISIHKPYWKQVWFFILATLLFAALSITIHRLRTLSLRKSKLLLEETVNIKTLELKTEKEQVEKINELLEENNEHITSSINYAQNIQAAVFPSLDKMKEKLDIFIIYHALDIVSGDFYWHYETDKYFYIAAVDCTGHGVPGAFMSLLGSTYLEQIVSDNNQILPSQIIKKLDDKLYNSFNKGTNSKLIRDGMDLSLCRIAKEKNEIIVSGASRPVYLIINNEFVEFKSSNFSLGGIIDRETKAFEDKTFVVNKGDTIYLFSDGITDQFGGEKNKRYSSKRFKSFLQSIAHFNIDEQEQKLEQEFLSWKANWHQTDDVLVIGVKF